MSCMLTVSPRPLTISPFSVRAVCLLMLLESEWRSSTFFATTTPLAFCHGPFPMRSRVGKGNGADLGGLAVPDAHCQALAKAAGSTETNWRAYRALLNREASLA